MSRRWAAALMALTMAGCVQEHEVALEIVGFDALPSDVLLELHVVEGASCATLTDAARSGGLPAAPLLRAELESGVAIPHELSGGGVRSFLVTATHRPSCDLVAVGCSERELSTDGPVTVRMELVAPFPTCPSGAQCRDGRCEGPASPDGGPEVDASEEPCLRDGEDCFLEDAERPGLCCAGRCVDVENDPSSCGTCGRSCGGSMPGEEIGCCGGECVDVASDPNHCGTCFNRCPSGSCTGGRCPLAVRVQSMASSGIEGGVREVAYWFQLDAERASMLDVEIIDQAVLDPDASMGAVLEIADPPPDPLRVCLRDDACPGGSTECGCDPAGAQVGFGVIGAYPASAGDILPTRFDDMGPWAYADAVFVWSGDAATADDWVRLNDTHPGLGLSDLFAGASSVPPPGFSVWRQAEGGRFERVPSSPPEVPSTTHPSLCDPAEPGCDPAPPLAPRP